MKSVVKGGLLAMVLALSSYAAAQEITIASWNMRWLTEETNEHNNRREVEYRTLRQYAGKLNADVIALQEVENPTAAFQVFGPSYTYYFSEDPGSRLRTGVLVRETGQLRVTDSNRYFPLNATGTLPEGIDITITNGDKSLRILNVDLKEGCPRENLIAGADPDCQILSDQVDLLGTYVADRAKMSVPFMIVGDFGRHLAAELERDLPDDLMTRIGSRYPDYLGSLRLLNTDKPGCWGGREERMVDHMILDPKTAAMLIPGTFTELLYSERNFDTHSLRLSDHCPISARFVLR